MYIFPNTRDKIPSAWIGVVADLRRMPSADPAAVQQLCAIGRFEIGIAVEAPRRCAESMGLLRARWQAKRVQTAAKAISGNIREWPLGFVVEPSA